MVCVQCLFSLFFSFFLFFILFISVVFHKYLWQNLMPNVVKYKCSVSSHFSSERWTLCARCTHVQQRFIIDIIIGHVRRDLFAIIYERSVWASVVLICCILMWLWCLCWSAVVASGGLVAHPHTLSLSLLFFFSFWLCVCCCLLPALLHSVHIAQSVGITMPCHWTFAIRTQTGLCILCHILRCNACCDRCEKTAVVNQIFAHFSLSIRHKGSH